MTEEERSGATPFRFKRKQDEDDGDQARMQAGQHRRYRREHRRHRSSRKRHRLSHERREDHPDTKLPPDVAFRESLFDALGDDEGADYWQGVYGQPIHNYPRNCADAESGELETMDDEQYVQYVRRKMWEKSAEGIEAAREAKRRDRQEEEAARRRRKTEEYAAHSTANSGNNNAGFTSEIEASLSRGRQRKERKRWQEIWKNYNAKWTTLHDLSKLRTEPSVDDSEQIVLGKKIAWPVESGKQKDVSSDEVERFINRVSEALQTEQQDSTTARASILKAERIKWHPDKIQQRYGFMQIEQPTREGVTAVFQVLDRLWTEARTHKR